ncbi:hypothetical protein PFISCL1PPCAC_13203, partial [Pristionchus fissidentatus]
ATKNLCPVYVFSSNGYVDTGYRRVLTHYLERNENLSPVQIVDREGENIFFRDYITPEDMESWDRHTEKAIQMEQ